MERQALVTFKDKRAGTLLEIPGGGTRFVYAQGWAETVACALPALRREHDWSAGLHPVFQHLTAESAAPAAERLEALPETAYRTISGVQRKVLAVRGPDGGFEAAGVDGPAPFIAKLNNPGQDTLVRNEALSLCFAAALLGPGHVTRFERGRFSDGEGALFVERFDRTPSGGKLRLEDFAQILSRGRGRDFGGKYDGSHEQVADGIREHSARPRIDLDQFFRRVVVNGLLGNCDAHLKNWSLLETPQGLRLSPAYDILNTALYDGFSTEFALAIGSERVRIDRLDRRLLEAFGERIGLGSKAVGLALRDIAAGMRRNRILDVPSAEPADGFRNRYSEIVRSACHRILEA